MDLTTARDALRLSDAEFKELVTPSKERPDGKLQDLMARGKTFEEALEDAQFETYRPSSIPFMKSDDGSVDLAKLPHVSLSLENGRQKLDFARIHFSKRDADLADAVLQDYLLAARKLPSLHLMIVTDRRADLDRALAKTSKEIRERIQIVETGKDLWIWAQDGSKPLARQRRSVFKAGSVASRKLIANRTSRWRPGASHDTPTVAEFDSRSPTRRRSPRCLRVKPVRFTGNSRAGLRVSALFWGR